MSRESPEGSLAAFVAAAVFLFAYVLLSGDSAMASDVPAVQAPQPPCQCRHSDDSPPRPQVRNAPADAPYNLDIGDEIAVLEAVQFALSEVGDGATYVWHRTHGHLSGYVHVARSYKAEGGGICRAMIVMLTSGPRHQRIETAACRRADGVWQLAG